MSDADRARGRIVSRAVLAVTAIALVALAALVVINIRHDQREDAVAASSQAAESTLEKLLSYEAGSVEAELEAELRSLTGDFRDEYRQLMKEQIIPAATKADVTTRATVVSTAVVEPGRDRVELLVFVNVSTNSNELESERTSGARLKVTMVKVDDTWKIGEFTPV